jgi:PadR family transcriptional regulator, regulatory protein PadR
MRTENLVSNFELMVLLALIRLSDGAYGVPISREIEQQSRRPVSMASIYAALTRLENKGFIRSEMGDPTSERGGRAKKYFKVTASGLREVREVKGTLARMWSGIPDLEGGRG